MRCDMRFQCKAMFFETRQPPTIGLYKQIQRLQSGNALVILKRKYLGIHPLSLANIHRLNSLLAGGSSNSFQIGNYKTSTGNIREYNICNFIIFLAVLKIPCCNSILISYFIVRTWLGKKTLLTKKVSGMHVPVFPEVDPRSVNQPSAVLAGDN